MSNLDPQAQAVLAELHPTPIESLSPSEARRQPTPTDAVRSILERRDGSAEPEEVGSTEELNIAGVGVRIYRPQGHGHGWIDRVKDAFGGHDDEALPVLVYVHGGGWVIADLDVYDATPRALANRAECIVVSVDYRRAPEHPFPAAHDDVLAVTGWLLDYASELGGDPARVAIGGESAGGNMATATCLSLQAAGERLPILQLLVYPVTDLVGLDYESYRDSADARPLSVPMLEWFGSHLMTDPAQAGDPRLSPLRAPEPELATLPPALVITAESDPLRGQGEAYAEKLRSLGVPVAATRYPGTMHEFFGMTAVMDVADRAMDEAAESLRAAFARATAGRH